MSGRGRRPRSFRVRSAILLRPIFSRSTRLSFPFPSPLDACRLALRRVLKQQKVNKSFIHFLHSSFPVNVLFYNDNETAILFKMTVLLVKLKEPGRVLLFTFSALGISDTNINITVTAYLTKTIPIKNTAHNLILCYYINKCFRMSFTYLH